MGTTFHNFTLVHGSISDETHPFTEVKSCDQTQDMTVLNDSQYMQIKAQTGSISKRFDIFSKNIS